MACLHPHDLGYRDVDGDPHRWQLITNMAATAEWLATKRLRAWERQHLGLVAGERLLDVGCGLGDAAIALASDLGAAGELVGVDASEIMLAIARQRSGEVLGDVRFSVGDARSLGEADGSFDVVRSERLLQWVPGPEMVVAELARVLRPGGRLSLIDTDWSTLRLDVGDPEVGRAVREGLRVERRRPSNVGRRLGELAERVGLEVLARATETQVWTTWDPDESPAPEGCFSMASLAEDLVERGQLEPSGRRQFVDTIHRAARGGRLEMSLTMYAVVAASPPRES